MSGPAQIQGIFDALTAEITTRRPDVVQLLGAQHLHTNGAAPRIVWVPGADSYKGNRNAANRSPAGVASVLTKVLGLSLYIWGASYTETEELNRLVIALGDLVFGPSFNVVSGEWDQAGEAAEQGILYTLLITMDVPCTLSIEDQRLTKRTIVNYPIASKVVG